MSKIRLYLDEDMMRRALKQALRNAGVDVVITSEADNLRRTDEEQLIWSTSEQRVIYTFNVRDFRRIHAEFLEQGRLHAGIVVAAYQNYSIGEQVRGLLNLIETTSAEEMQNQLVYIGTYIRNDSR